MGFIYQIKNKVTYKSYIGITKQDPVTRWKGHLNSIHHNRGCPALGDAINTYGINNFIFKVLIICFDEDLYKYEIEYIKKYNTMVPNGYNILEGGQCGGGFKGHKHSEETKSLLKDKLRNMYSDPILRKQIGERTKKALSQINIRERMMKSRKWHDYVNRRRTDPNSQRLSKDQKAKISESLKLYHQRPDVDLTERNDNLRRFYKQEDHLEKHRALMSKLCGRRIVHTDLSNNTITVYDSFAEASRRTGISDASIRRYINGVTTKFQGLHHFASV